LLDLLPGVAEAAGLLGAAGRVVARVEVEDHVLPGVVRERHLFAALIAEREVRRGLAFELGHRSLRRSQRFPALASTSNPARSVLWRACPEEPCRATTSTSS